MKCSLVWIFLLMTIVQMVSASPSMISDRHSEGFLSSPARLAREFSETTTVEFEDETEKILYANRNQYPFMVAIFKFKEDGYRFACGASLISINKILTAAHCVTYSRTKISMNVEHLKVKLGMHFLNATSDDAQMTVNVSRIKIHEDYNHKTRLNNIAILTLESDVGHTETMSPVCLMPNDYYDYKDLYTTMGWINTPSQWNNTDQLWRSMVMLWPYIFWKDEFAQLGFKLTNRMFYATWNGEFGCRNDDGSPMIAELWNGSGSTSLGGCRYMQIGIVSIARGCLTTKLAGVYTRVEMFMPWIKVNAPDITVASLPIREIETSADTYVTVDPEITT